MNPIELLRLINNLTRLGTIAHVDHPRLGPAHQRYGARLFSMARSAVPRAGARRGYRAQYRARQTSATIIKYEIEAGTFDYARHFPESKRLLESRFGYYLDLWLAIKKRSRNSTLSSWPLVDPD